MVGRFDKEETMKASYASTAAASGIHGP